MTDLTAMIKEIYLVERKIAITTPVQLQKVNDQIVSDKLLFVWVLAFDYIVYFD